MVDESYSSNAIGPYQALVAFICLIECTDGRIDG